VPRHSDRLAAMSAFLDPNPEKQAKRVLLGKWQPSASALRSAPATPDATIAARFRETFRVPLSSSKREALQELYPFDWCSREATHAPGLAGSSPIVIKFVLYLVHYLSFTIKPVICVSVCLCGVLDNSLLFAA
jgi:hypothetical protein